MEINDINKNHEITVHVSLLFDILLKIYKQNNLLVGFIEKSDEPVPGLYDA